METKWAPQDSYMGQVWAPLAMYVIREVTRKKTFWGFSHFGGGGCCIKFGHISYGFGLL